MSPQPARCSNSVVSMARPWPQSLFPENCADLLLLHRWTKKKQSKTSAEAALLQNLSSQEQFATLDGLSESVPPAKCHHPQPQGGNWGKGGYFLHPGLIGRREISRRV
jgi:hypothetical protein